MGPKPYVVEFKIIAHFGCYWSYFYPSLKLRFLEISILTKICLFFLQKLNIWQFPTVPKPNQEMRKTSIDFVDPEI